MGMFKDLRDLHKASKEIERPGLRDSLKQANEAVQTFQAGQQQAVDVAANGVLGKATITAMRDTGTVINEMHVLALDLTVEVNGFQSEVTHTEPISPLLIGRLAPGAEITVKVDPGDHSRLILIP
ncbi:MAG: hypothetical protein ABI726_11050 [bacterium]